jgi:DNA-binding IclR family transcriptional regulator
MKLDSPQIPSDDDFQQTAPQILRFLRKRSKPAALEEIAKNIKRDRAVTERYCDRLREAGIINYIPTGDGTFGFLAW